jgi:predicted O-methyltransferase YrrM
MSTSMRERIVSAYDQHVLKRSVLSIRDGEGVLHAILGGGRYRRILEIGTYRGVGAACLSQFCHRVVTIDLHHGRMEQLGESWDRRGFWRQLGVHNVDLRLVHDNGEKARLIAALDFDFAFIDGAHDETVRDDFAMVKRCGAVLFHDYDRRGRKDQDCVADFVDTLPQDQVTVMDIFALWTAPHG